MDLLKEDLNTYMTILNSDEYKEVNTLMRNFNELSHNINKYCKDNNITEVNFKYLGENYKLTFDKVQQPPMIQWRKKIIKTSF